MSNSVLPALPGLAFGVNMSPRWNTSIQTAISGRETRIQLMPYPLYDVDLVYEVLRSSAIYTELQQLIAFFNLVAGAWDNWLWSNPDDNAVTAQALGIGNGAQTAFTMLRSYGGYSEPVWWPVTGYTVYVNGVAKVLGTDYTFSNGVITFVTAPPNTQAVTWTGSFYYRCRFKDDTNQFSKFMQNLWELKKMSFIANLQGRL